MNPTPRPDPSGPDRNIRQWKPPTPEREYLATTREYLGVVTRGRQHMPRALILLDEALDALDMENPDRAEAKIKRAIAALNRIDPMSSDW